MSAESKVTKSYLIKWAITLIIPLLIYLIPTNDVFTDQLRLFFVITVLVLETFAFEFFPMLVPSVLLSVLYIITGLVPAEVALSPWTNTTVYMVLGAFLLANVLEECGLLHRISVFCIRLCGGTYNGALYGLFLTGIVLAFVTFNNHYIIMVIFTYSVIKAFGYDRPCKEAAIMTMVGCLGAVGTASSVYNPSYVSLAQSGLELVAGEWPIPWYVQTLTCWPTLLFGFFFIWVMTKIFKTKNFSSNTGKQFYDEEHKRLGKMSPKERKATILTVILMAYLFSSPIHGLPIAYGFMIVPFLAFFPGIRVGTEQAVKKLDMGVIFFIVSCMSIGSVGTALGISDYISTVMGPMLEGMSPIAVLTALLGSGTLANLVMTPFAMCSSLAAPFTQIAIDAGLNPEVSIMTLIISTDIYFLPHEVTCLLVAMGFGLIKMKDFIKYATLKSGLYFIWFLVIQVPYWYLIGYIY